ERDMFDKSLKRKWDEKAVRDYHHQVGYEEGREVGRKEGREEGREEGRKEGREERRAEGREEGAKQKKHELIINLIRQTDFDDARIASLTDTDPDVVRKVRAEISH